MDRHIEDVQGKSHPGFGRCIFCRLDGGGNGLRREHIIPKSLGGNAVIQEASCKACEAITSYVDGYLAKAIYQEYRAHTDAPSRRKKARPTESLARVIIDGVEDVRIFQTKAKPYFLAMPVWGLPTALTAGIPSPNFPTMKAHIYEFIPADIRERLGVDASGSVQVRGTGKINYSTFARGIAKIAYCNAVMRYGLEGFRPFPIVDVILGKSPYASHFVGVPLDDPPPPEPRGIVHKVEFDVWASPSGQILVSTIRLFAHSGTEQTGMPIYHVAIGQPKHSRPLATQ